MSIHPEAIITARAAEDVAATPDTLVQIVDFASLVEEQQAAVSAWVSEQTLEYETMLDYTPEQIPLKHLGAVAVAKSGDSDHWEIAGYMGADNAAELDGKAMAEIGTLVVALAYRHQEFEIKKLTDNETQRQRVADALVDVITRLALDNGETPYAFCNELSLPVLKRHENGGRYEVATLGDVPPIAKDLCENCEVRCALAEKLQPLPDNECCDTIVVWNPADQLSPQQS